MSRRRTAGPLIMTDRGPNARYARHTQCSLPSFSKGALGTEAMAASSVFSESWPFRRCTSKRWSPVSCFVAESRRQSVLEASDQSDRGPDVHHRESPILFPSLSFAHVLAVIQQHPSRSVFLDGLLGLALAVLSRYVTRVPPYLRVTAKSLPKLFPSMSL